MGMLYGSNKILLHSFDCVKIMIIFFAYVVLEQRQHLHTCIAATF